MLRSNILWTLLVGKVQFYQNRGAQSRPIVSYSKGLQTAPSYYCHRVWSPVTRPHLQARFGPRNPKFSYFFMMYQLTLHSEISGCRLLIEWGYTLNPALASKLSHNADNVHFSCSPMLYLRMVVLALWNKGTHHILSGITVQNHKVVSCTTLLDRSQTLCKKFISLGGLSFADSQNLLSKHFFWNLIVHIFA